MPRDLPLGNGRMLLCFDRNYAIRDLYFPHVGQENHSGGNFFRLGVRVDHRFSWVGEEWRLDLRYQEDTLVTEVTLYHPELAVMLHCRDCVDFHENIYARLIRVENMQPHRREVRLFFSQDFDISGNSVGDTAAWDPKSSAVVHYKGPRYFLAGASRGESRGIDQFAVGQKHSQGKEGTYRDAEDGILSGNTIAQGSVDSVIGLHLTIEATSSAEAAYWLCAGENWEEVRRLDSLVKHKGPEALLARTAAFWNLWVQKETPALEILPEAISRSLPPEHARSPHPDRLAGRDPRGQRLRRHSLQSRHLLLHLAPRRRPGRQRSRSRRLPRALPRVLSVRRRRGAP